MALSLFSLSCAVFAFALFAQAGVSKLREPGTYTEVVSRYLGRSVGQGFVFVIGAVEVLLSILVLLPKTREVAGLVAAALLLVYGGLMARQVTRGGHAMRCGCGAAGSDTVISPELIIRNVVIAIPVLIMGMGAREAITPQIALVGVAAGTLLSILYVALDQLIANRQKLQGWY